MKDRVTIGLALGAGAARGMAHIGVIRALEESGIPVDMVAGCSMGAIIGALYVTGADLELFAKLCAQMDMKKLTDVAVKKPGLIKGNKIQEMVRLLTKDKSFEETDIPFQCVAVRLRDGELVAFKEGKIHPAVRASIAIPGGFVPQEIDGEWYVDGGIVERVPVQTLQKMGADFIIGVDVSYRGQEQKRPRNSMQLMQQAMNIMSHEIARTKMYDADVLIAPKVRSIRPYSNKQVDECVKRGYEATMQSMEEIRAKIEKANEARKKEIL